MKKPDPKARHGTCKQRSDLNLAGFRITGTAQNLHPSGTLALNWRESEIKTRTNGVETNLLLALLEERLGINLRRAALPNLFKEVDVIVSLREEALDVLGSGSNPTLGERNPALVVLSIELRTERRREDCSSSLLGIEASASFKAGMLSECCFQLFDERAIGIGEQIGCTTVDREEQRFLVNRSALVANKEDKDKATPLVRRGLARILLLPIIVKVRIARIDPLDTTLLRVLDEGDILSETAVQHNHARSLEEDSFVAIAVVVGVVVLLSIRELIGSTVPANTGKHRILQEQTALGLVVEDLAVAEVTQDTLVLLSVEVAIQYRHYSQNVGTVPRAGVAPTQRVGTAGTDLRKKRLQ